MSRRTKIVATIGPASRDPEVLLKLVRAGMDVARLNFSHGSHAEHHEVANLVRTAAERAGRPVAILQDLPGPKLRIGRLADETQPLAAGNIVTFVTGAEDDEPGWSEELRIPMPWEGLTRGIAPGEVLYLADGRIRLRCTEIRGLDVLAEVETSGTVASRQGLNIPGPTNELPSVPEEDLGHLQAGIEIGVDMVALSFVRSAADVEFVREHTRAPLIAKIEKPQAVENIEEILEAADCMMVARGDLGIELPIEEVPMVQKMLLAQAGRRARPSITATQMLDSMVVSSRPTRAEVADIANAILDGTDAIMLSQETAVGAHPIEAVEMMDAVARHTEKSAPYRSWNESRVRRDWRDPAYTIAHSACQAAVELDLDALVIPTLSGRSVRIISAHRPQVPIFALSPGRETVRRCGLMWGVRAASMGRFEITEELILQASRRVVELGWLPAGARVGITAGLPSGKPGTTSLFQVQELPPL